MVSDGLRKLHYWSDRDLDMFSFDGQCVYGDLRCLSNKTNMPKEKQIRISSNLFLPYKQEMKYDILDVTLWKNIKCVMLILFFAHDRR